MKKFMFALLLGLTAVSSFAAAPKTFWDKQDYGQYSTYSGTRAGGWNFSGPTTVDKVYSGRVLRCPKSAGVINCLQRYSDTIEYSWTWATQASFTLTVIPDVFNLSLASTYTRGQSRSYADIFDVSIKPGYFSQHIEVVPRRKGNISFYGARVKTGKKREVCRTNYIRCVLQDTQYEYYVDPKKIITVLNGQANSSKSKLPERTFLVDVDRYSYSN